MMGRLIKKFNRNKFKNYKKAFRKALQTAIRLSWTKLITNCQKAIKFKSLTHHLFRIVLLFNQINNPMIKLNRRLKFKNPIKISLYNKTLSFNKLLSNNQRPDNSRMNRFRKSHQKYQ